MRKVAEIHSQETAMSTLVELTSIFEGLASMRIAKIKDQVLQSSKFFKELWSIYSQIKVSEEFKFGREESDTTILDKELLVIVTAEGSFSGDIDQKLVRLMQKDYDKGKNDVIVIGHHGAMQLAQAAITYTKYYKMPQRDLDINVTPIVEEIRKYRTTKVYYQEYVSLMVQDVRRIDLSHAVNIRGEENKPVEDNIIDEKTYIFEPSTYAVVAHLERSMMQITISQLILESKLAQYASRFQAMRASNDRASETRDDLKIEFNRAKRAIKDERLKEIVNGLKKSQVRTVG
jgi:F-type H+-transporting ATPase subunit gamma